MLSKPSNDLDKKLLALIDSVSELTITVKTMAIEHKTLSQDQDALEKRVSTNEQEIRSLQKKGAEIDTVSNLAKYGGLALLAAIGASWNSLSTKVEIVTSKADANTQNIVHLQKDNLDDQKQLDDMAAKIANNKEMILKEMKYEQGK